MRKFSLSFLIGLVAAFAGAQDHPKIQKDFPAEEFVERRARVIEAIGESGIAIVQGAPADPGFRVFRQSNEFYYLTGIEVPHSYLLIDGGARRSLLFLPRRDPRKERGEGRMLGAEDVEEVKRVTGVDDVFAIDQMARQLFGFALRPPSPTLHTFLSPAEGRAQSRDENLIGHAQHVSDPWDGRASREGAFVAKLRERYPQFPIADLTPIVDTMRLHKSPRELELVRRASELAGMGIMEAMRSTKPGLYEYQLDAAAYYIYRINGAQGEGYRSITGTGTNAYFGHYYRNDAELKDGELILMDYAPDYRYYTSDVARMWPINGVFTEDQRKLYTFIVHYNEALLSRLRPGVTPDQVMDEAAEAMEPVIDELGFTNPLHEKAAREALSFRGHLSHPTGLAVHDVGSYRGRPFESGLAFSVDPMLWVHEERLYVRMEDIVAITENGVENFTDFMPRTVEEIEAFMREEGVLQLTPPNPGTPAPPPR